MNRSPPEPRSSRPTCRRAQAQRNRGARVSRPALRFRGFFFLGDRDEELEIGFVDLERVRRGGSGIAQVLFDLRELVLYPLEELHAIDASHRLVEVGLDAARA